MTMTAKYPGKCTCCGGEISVGETIEWKKGEGARHPACRPSSRTARALPRSPKPRATRAASQPKAPPEGCSFLHRRSQSQGDNYEVGQVVRVKNSSNGGGDGTYFTVVRVERKWRDDDTDEWMVGCYARPSTADECADRMEARQKATELATLKQELRELQVAAPEKFSDDEARKPSGIELVLNKGTHGSGVEVAVLGEDGSVAVWCSGYYDDYRQTLAVIRDPRAGEIFQKLSAAG